MMTVNLVHFLTVAMLIFFTGLLGIVLNRRNIIIMLMSIELMLIAININLIAYSAYLDDIIGQLFALLILTVAAAESAIGLAIIVIFYRVRGTISVDSINLLKG